MFCKNELFRRSRLYWNVNYTTIPWRGRQNIDLSDGHHLHVSNLKQTNQNNAVQYRHAPQTKELQNSSVWHIRLLWRKSRESLRQLISGLSAAAQPNPNVSPYRICQEIHRSLPRDSCTVLPPILPERRVLIGNISICSNAAICWLDSILQHLSFDKWFNRGDMHWAKAAKTWGGSKPLPINLHHM